jgi:hypothetical protein
MTHPTEEDLILLVYDEIEDGAPVREHLAGCPECQDELASLKRTLAEVDELDPPERGEDYGARVWRRLEPSLRAPRGFRFHYLVAAAAAVVLVAFFVGRLSVDRTEERPENVRERVLLVALSSHLEDSQVLLLEAANGGEDVDRVRAEDLLRASRLYRQSAVRLGDVTTVDVLEDLERILLDVSQGPEADRSAIGERIVERDVLFKIRVLQASLREREKKSVRKF